MSFIYAITALGRTDVPVKIGFTAALHDRVRALQTGCWEILAVVAARAGVLADEKALHAQFESARIHGEWFQRTPDINAFIATNACTPITSTTSRTDGQPTPLAAPWRPWTPEEGPLLKAAEVAALLNKQPREIRRLARERQIVFVNVGIEDRVNMRFRRHDVDAFIARSL